MKDIYNLLASYIKDISIKIKLETRTFWVGKDTVEEAKRDKFKLLPISDIEILSFLTN